jgi:hypothetical protein
VPTKKTCCRPKKTPDPEKWAVQFKSVVDRAYLSRGPALPAAWLGSWARIPLTLPNHHGHTSAYLAPG